MTDDETCDVFMVERAEDLVRVLAEDTFWANTDERRPGWGQFRREDLEPVRIETVRRVESVTLDMPIMFLPVEVRDVPVAVARRRLGGSVAEARYYVQVVAPVPEGMSRADVDARVGRPAYFRDASTERTVLGAADLPDEYRDLVKCEGVLLICGGV